MVLALPATTDEQVAQFESEYRSAFEGASQAELENAKCRLIWALAHHAGSRAGLQRALDLAEAALAPGASPPVPPDQARELRYLAAVAMYNMGAYIRARRALRALLTDHPDFRQAAALAQECDDLVLRDGLVGVGVLGGVLGVGLGLLVGASRRR